MFSVRAALHIPPRCRGISQRVLIQTAKAKGRFSVNMLKTPSSYGYYTSRVNRPYNEDRYQIGVLDMDVAEDSVLEGGSAEDNAELEARINQLDEPQYSNEYQYSKVFNYSIFDGHGGDECSSYLRAHLLESIEKFRLTDSSVNSLIEFYRTKIGGYWKRWTRRETQQLINVMGIEYIIKSNNTGDLMIKDSTRLHDRKTKLWQLSEFHQQVTSFEFFKLRVFLSFLYADYQFLTYENRFNEIAEQKMQQMQENSESLDDERESRVMHAGSTCTSAFLYCLDKNPDDMDGYYFQDGVLSRLLVAQIGDTRAIICDKDGVAHALTRDHHPSNPTEARRLTKFATNLIITDSFGEERYLNFANTRAFGDISAKDVGVSAEPEFSDFLIGDSKKLAAYKDEHAEYIEQMGIQDFGGDECFLVLVSDGVTNSMTDQEVVDVIMTSTNSKGPHEGTPAAAAREVVNYVEDVGGDDNATCCIIRLSKWDSWPRNDRTKHLRDERMSTMLRRT